MDWGRKKLQKIVDKIRKWFILDLCRIVKNRFIFILTNTIEVNGGQNEESGFLLGGDDTFDLWGNLCVCGSGWRAKNTDSGDDI